MGQTASHPTHTLEPRPRSRGPSPSPSRAPTGRTHSPLPLSTHTPTQPPQKPTQARKRSLELPGLTNKLTITPHVRSPPPQSIPIPIRGPTQDRERDRERIHRFNNTDSQLDVQTMNDVLPAPQYPPHHGPSPSHRRGGYHAPPSSLVARPVASTPPPMVSSPPKRRSPKKTGEHIYSTIPLGVYKGKARADTPLTTPSTTLIPTRICWRGDGIRVELAGTFDRDWQSRRPLAWDPTTRAHVTTLDLRPGTYRLKFIVDDQWKCSDHLPTAVDDTGNLVNYIEVADEAFGEVLGWEKGLSSAPDQLPPWTSEIPPLLVQAAQLEENYLARRGEPNSPSPPLIPHPPALPRHLEKVILNARTTGTASAASGVGKPVASAGGVGPAGGADDNSVLPVPNHVVLNHLGTSAIKGGVLAVGTTTRYHRKYITTIYYKPVS
ncbi:hypothetical protein RSOLAG22IIIB_03623 [Rhizoctonia solani]|uniref:Association with the SNF1 complex (ASC) domain-containing protein n=1 Tax=Rhizoctonia solani TaxID=456999 RepID=A0A0K6FRZ1_9AGAM|nr:hypothetical protein RSOLAG22IIIB_03623 [Rhizoctonia solani]